MLNVIWQHLEIPYMTYMSDIILYSFNFYFNTRSSHTPCLFLKSDRVQCKRLKNKLSAHCLKSIVLHREVCLLLCPNHFYKPSKLPQS